MKYLSHLPTEKCLIDLAQKVEFPISRNQLILAAYRNGISESSVRFLRLFDSTDTFENGVDLINRAEEMKLLINDARQAQPELVSSAEC